jgi:hypothetical protein
LTIATSRICEIAWRRACRSPRLPSVTSFSTIGTQILRLGQRGDDLLVLDQRRAMLANIALRCSAVRLKRRSRNP